MTTKRTKGHRAFVRAGRERIDPERGRNAGCGSADDVASKRRRRRRRRRGRTGAATASRTAAADRRRRRRDGAHAGSTDAGVGARRGRSRNVRRRTETLVENVVPVWMKAFASERSDPGLYGRRSKLLGRVVAACDYRIPSSATCLDGVICSLRSRYYSSVESALNCSTRRGGRNADLAMTGDHNRDDAWRTTSDRT